MNRLLALLLPIVALTSGGEASRDKAPDPVVLAKLWGASLKAESLADFDSALENVEAFANEGGDPYMSQLRAGWLNSQKVESAKAIEAYSAASKLQPTSITPLLGILAVAQATNDPVRIERAAEGLLRAEPTNYKGEMALANVRYAVKDYRRALNSYRRVLKSYPEDNDAASGAAWSACNVGEVKEALVLFSRILSLNPDYPLAQQGFERCGGKPSGFASSH